MKIAIIRSFPSVLDASKYNVQEFGLAKAMVAFGISVDVYCAGNNDETRFSILKESDGIIARVVHLRYREVPPHNGLFPDLLQLLQGGSYDLIQAQDFEQITVFRAARFAATHNIPFVIHQGVYDNSAYGRLQKLWVALFRETCGRYLAKNTAACIAKTDVAKEYLEDAGFHDITVLPIGLDHSKLDTNEDRDWRGEIGICTTTKTLLYVGIIEKRRNVDFLIRVTDRLLKSGKDVCLVVAGRGPQQAECEDLVRSLGINDRVFFIGMREQKELPGLYKLAELFLLASNSEIVGMVLLESLYCNLPIFSTATAGGKDIVGVRFGKVFENLDVSDWAADISSYLDNPERFPFSKEKLAGMPFERSWQALGERYASFYQKIVENG